MRPTAGVVGDTPVGGGTPREALTLAPHRHDQLLQTDAVHALCQVTVPVHTTPSNASLRHTMTQHLVCIAVCSHSAVVKAPVTQNASPSD